MAGKLLVKNRKARHEYEILDKFEAGIVLSGTEVKSIRAGRANLGEGWIGIENGELFLRQVHISHYSHGNRFNHGETRPRKLLMHRKEIDRLEASVQQKGLSLIPLAITLRGQYIKLEVGLGRGKKLHDKRDSSKKREASRQIERAMKKHNR